jgi:hypothetical protein
MSSFTPARLRRTAVRLAAFASVAAVAACGDNPASANPIAGTYTASTFQVIPEGMTNALDVKAAGGTLTITVNEDNTTSGQLVVPGALIGSPTDFVASMAGTVTVTGSTATFHQTADTFIRDLTWTVSGHTISVNGQVLTGDT